MSMPQFFWSWTMFLMVYCLVFIQAVVFAAILFGLLCYMVDDDVH
jgi:hypothetical protein